MGNALLIASAIAIVAILIAQRINARRKARRRHRRTSIGGVFGFALRAPRAPQAVRREVGHV